jgi:septum formation topological specificity factor MinE
MDSLELSTLKLELLNLAQDLVLSIYKGTANDISEEEMSFEIIDIANKYLLFVGEDDLKFNILVIAHTRVMETDCDFLEEKTQSVLDIAAKYLAYTNSDN